MKYLKYELCKAGDIIVNEDGEEAPIIATEEKGLWAESFRINVVAHFYSWEEVEQGAKHNGWHIKEKEPSVYLDLHHCNKIPPEFDAVAKIKGDECPYCGEVFGKPTKEEILEMITITSYDARSETLSRIDIDPERLADYLSKL